MKSSPSPEPRVFLTAEWRALLMVNFAVDPLLLKPLVPCGTELDYWEGQALVSIVGFRFLDTRVLGFRVPLHRNFEEVNLRFYVRRKTTDGWRRGVVFVKEIVPRMAIALIARLAYNEPYVALPMRHEVQLDPQQGGGLRYEWYAGKSWNHLAAKVHGEAQSLTEGSPEEFIFEHYWGYTKQRDGSAVEYEVRHEPWRVWSATDVRFRCDIASLYGPEWKEPLSANYVSAFVADGSSVEVRRCCTLRPDSL
ncbi:YqjF family protein [Verrucomicrobiota bacterium sgz303538]